MEVNAGSVLNPTVQSWLSGSVFSLRYEERRVSSVFIWGNRSLESYIAKMSISN